MRPSREAFRFFCENAGGVVGHCAEGAIALARAEARAKGLGLGFHWEEEQEAWDGDSPAPDELLWCGAYTREDFGPDGCTLKRRAIPLASLGMIGFNNKTPEDWRHRMDYERVVEAELAMEALPYVEETPSHWMAL